MSIQKAKFAIIGSGISGLSLAWYLSRKIDPKQIVLIEKDSKLGGWIDTTKEDGFLFERGPRTFRPSKSKELIELIEDVGMASEKFVNKFFKNALSRKFTLLFPYTNLKTDMQQ